MSTYEKPWLSVTDQIAKLQSRGLQIADKQEMEAALRRIGYYRLSLYTFTFRQREPESGTLLDQYVEGSTADQVLALYEFDRRLRLLLLSALERVEIATRFSVAHVLGEHDSMGHLHVESLGYGFQQPSKLDPSRSKHAVWLESYERRQDEAHDREEFVRHFARRYNSELPIWSAVEIMQFGELSVLCQGLRPTDRVAVAEHYGLDRRRMVSWLHHLAYVRNVCAHHARLWNRPLVIQPKRPDSGSSIARLFEERPNLHTRSLAPIVILHYFLSAIDPESNWFHEIRLLLRSFPRGGPVNDQEMGCLLDEYAYDVLPSAPSH